MPPVSGFESEANGRPATTLGKRLARGCFVFSAEYEAQEAPAFNKTKGFPNPGDLAQGLQGRWHSPILTKF